MLTGPPAILLYLCSVVPGPAPSRDVLVQVLDRCDGAARPPIEGHYFSEQQVELTVRVFGLVNSRVDLAGRLFQLTDQLAAPIDGPVWSVNGKAIGDHLWEDVSCCFTAPAVTRIARFELRVFYRRSGEKAWQAAGQYRLRAYPRNLLDPLRIMAGKRPFLVLDDQGVLQGFLQQQNIGFVDSEHLERIARGSIVPGTEACAVAVWVPPSRKGETGPAGLDRGVLGELKSRADAVIAFREQEHTVPRVIFKPLGDGQLVDVEMSIVGSLATSPRAQLVFLETIRMACSHVGLDSIVERKDR